MGYRIMYDFYEKLLDAGYDAFTHIVDFPPTGTLILSASMLAVFGLVFGWIRFRG